MELRKVIEERRSIRKFKEKEVSKDIIEELIDCARLAPSAKNRQPWRFIIVNKDIKNKISDIMLDEEESKKDEEERKIKSSVKATAKIVKEAPVLILVLRENDKYWTVGDSLSIGAAIEHICLRATDLGLGSLWIRDTVYIQEKIAKLIGHEDMEVNCAISIGYPDEEPKQRPRKSLEEVCEWMCK